MKNRLLTLGFSLSVFSTLFFAALASAQTVGPGCRIDGCNGELCLEADAPAVATICRWKNEYSCYKKSFASCERQPKGRCAWSPNKLLLDCLKKLSNKGPLNPPAGNDDGGAPAVNCGAAIRVNAGEGWVAGSGSGIEPGQTDGLRLSR